MKPKSLRSLILSIAIFACCCVIYGYLQNESRRNKALDYAMCLITQRELMESTSPIKNSPLFAVDGLIIQDSSYVNEKVNEIYASYQQHGSNPLLSQDKSFNIVSSVIKSFKLITNVRIPVSPNAVDYNLITFITANMRRYTIGNISDVNTNTNDAYNLTPKTYEKTEPLITVNSSNEFGFIITGNYRSSNPQLLISQNRTDFKSNNSKSINYQINQLIAVVDLSPAQSSKRMFTNGTGTSSDEDGFSTGAGVDNGTHYNDNTNPNPTEPIIGSLPIPDGTSYLILLSLIFATYKKLSLNI